MVGAPEPQPARVVDVVGGHLLGQLGRGAPRGARRVVDLVVDVGDVRHERHVDALVLEEPLELGEDDVRPRVADVHAGVDRRAAGVDAHFARLARLERPYLAGLRVVEADRRAAERPRARPEAADSVPADADALEGGRRGLPDAPEPLPGRGGRLRRHLPRAPRRRRAHVGDPLYAARRPRADGRDPPPAGRRDRLRRRDLAAAAPGRAVGHRGVLPAPALRPRRAGPRARLRGPVPAPERPPAAAAHPRRARRPPEALDADDGRGPRARAAPARPRRRQVVLLRHGRRAQPPLPRPRDRPPRLRRLQQAAAGRATTPPFFARTVLGAMDAMGIDRAHIVGNSMGGRVAIEIGLEHPERVGGLALLCPAVAFVRREWHPRRARPAPRARPAAPLARAQPHRVPVLVDVRRPRPRRPHRGRHRRGRVRAHLPQRRRPAGVPHLGAQRLPGAPVRPRRLLPAPRAPRAAGHVRLVLARQADPARLPARTSSAGCPRAEQILLDGCGHVPQVERPEHTNGLLERFFARVDALGRAASESAA